MAREFARYEIGSQMMCLKEEMLKRVCDAWYSVAPNILEELYYSMPRKIAYLIKTSVQVCFCSFFGMYLKYDVVFSLECICYLYTNVFRLYVDMFIEVKWHDMVKHRP